MAEDTGQAKTEEPTPRRQDDARKRGQIATSTDLSTGILLLAGTSVLWFAGTSMGGELLQAMRSQLGGIRQSDWGLQLTTVLMAGVLHRILSIAGLFVALLFFTGLCVGSLQSQFNISFEPLNPDWSRISPTKGWSRLFSMRSVMRGINVILKVASIVFLTVWVVMGHASQVMTAGRGSLLSAVSSGWSIAILLAMAVGAGLVLIGAIDYLFQRWQHNQDLRMTRQEIKDERKQDEGDPLIRARIKKLQRETAQRRMMSDVPKASVVVTNPTHLAVALEYDRHTMPAPRVVAKGSGLVAKRIVKLAEEHEIPVLERKPIARALFAATNIGDEIPAALYQAVAEILVYVFNLKRGAA